VERSRGGGTEEGEGRRERWERREVGGEREVGGGRDGGMEGNDKRKKKLTLLEGLLQRLAIHQFFQISIGDGNVIRNIFQFPKKRYKF
jgi:hypothetical protein